MANPYLHSSTGKQAPAGLNVRMLAFAYDYLFIAAYAIVLTGVGILANRYAPRAMGALFSSPWIAQSVSFLTITLPVTLYFSVQESGARQSTFGKARAGLRVETVAGTRLTFGRALGRTLLKFVPWELAHTFMWQITSARDPSSPVYTMGFFLVCVLVLANVAAVVATDRKQALYDRLAGTVVVRAG